MQNLYLSTIEQKSFKTLPAALQEGYNIVPESDEGYETDDELRMRAAMTSIGKYEAMASLAKDIQSGKDIDSLTLAGMPPETALDFFFTVGARGLTNFVGIMLRTAKTDEDMETLRSLADARHEILAVNRLPLTV